MKMERKVEGCRIYSSGFLVPVGLMMSPADDIIDRQPYDERPLRLCTGDIIVLDSYSSSN